MSRLVLFTLGGMSIGATALGCAGLGGDDATAGYQAILANSTVQWEDPATGSGGTSGLDAGVDTSNLFKKGERSLFPEVVVDAQDRTHIVFATTNPDQLWYSNNFSEPVAIAMNVGEYKVPFFHLLRDAAGTKLHLVYTKGEKELFYAQNGLENTGFGWSTPEAILGNSAIKVAAPALAVDGSGRVQFAWTEKVACGDKDTLEFKIHFKAQTSGGALADAPTNRLSSDCLYETSPRLIVTKDQTVHAVFVHEKGIAHAEQAGGTWKTTDIDISGSSSTNSYGPSVDTDGTSLFVVWEEAFSPHQALFSRSDANGQNFSTPHPLSNTGAQGGAPAVVYSASTRRVYSVWADTQGILQSGHGALLTDIWFSEFDPNNGTSETAGQPMQGSFGESLRLSTSAEGGLGATLPNLAVGPRTIHAAWQSRGGSTQWAIFQREGRFTASASNGPATDSSNGVAGPSLAPPRRND